MPYKTLIHGQKVKVGGKPGSVMESSDKIKVKFEDGSFGFFDGNEITPDIIESELKSKNKFDRFKAESKLQNGAVFIDPIATGTDPLYQPVRATGQGVGGTQGALGKEIGEDIFSKQ